MGKLVMVGISHHATPLEVRERLAIDEAAWRAVAPGEPGSVMLSTCNRVEVYAWVEGRPASAARALSRALACATGVDASDLQPYLRVRAGTEALLHLVRVTSGLDSMVVGEEQIRGQVRTALRNADASGPLPPSLRGIVQRVGESARRVRGGTNLGAAPSVASAGISVALRAVSANAAAPRAVVLGAGVMARAATEALLARGVRVQVLNRGGRESGVGGREAGDRDLFSETRPEGDEIVAASIAPRLPTIGPLAALPAALVEADLLVGATASRSYLLSPDMVGDRAARPLVILDIALPRDVDPRVRQTRGVTLIDLDDLERMCPIDARTRGAELERAEALAVAETERLVEWLRFRAVGPAIAELRTYAEDVRKRELRRSAGRLRDLTPEQVAAVEALTAGIVNKLMHGPTIALRDAGARSRSRILRVVRPVRGRTV